MRARSPPFGNPCDTLAPSALIFKGLRAVIGVCRRRRLCSRNPQGKGFLRFGHYASPGRPRIVGRIEVAWAAGPIRGFSDP
jgi:hypothetical protein